MTDVAFLRRQAPDWLEQDFHLSFPTDGQYTPAGLGTEGSTPVLSEGCLQ
jgi:hypothetical protein